jgi:hypothetical protein
MVVFAQAGLACAVAVEAQTSAPQDLDGYVDHAMRVLEVPGVAVGIVKDGHFLFLCGRMAASTARAWRRFLRWPTSASIIGICC